MHDRRRRRHRNLSMSGLPQHQPQGSQSAVLNVNRPFTPPPWQNQSLNPHPPWINPPNPLTNLPPVPLTPPLPPPHVFSFDQSAPLPLPVVPPAVIAASILQHAAQAGFHPITSPGVPPRAPYNPGIVPTSGCLPQNIFLPSGPAIPQVRLPIHITRPWHQAPQSSPSPVQPPVSIQSALVQKAGAGGPAQSSTRPVAALQSKCADTTYSKETEEEKSGETLAAPSDQRQEKAVTEKQVLGKSQTSGSQAQKKSDQLSSRHRQEETGISQVRTQVLSDCGGVGRSRCPENDKGGSSQGECCLDKGAGQGTRQFSGAVLNDDDFRIEKGIQSLSFIDPEEDHDKDFVGGQKFRCAEDIPGLPSPVSPNMPRKAHYPRSCEGSKRKHNNDTTCDEPQQKQVCLGGAGSFPMQLSPPSSSNGTDERASPSLRWDGSEVCYDTEVPSFVWSDGEEGLDDGGILLVGGESEDTLEDGGEMNDSANPTRRETWPRRRPKLVCSCRSGVGLRVRSGSFRCMAVDRQMKGESVACMAKGPGSRMAPFYDRLTETWGQVCLQHFKRLMHHDFCPLCGQFTGKNAVQCVEIACHRFHAECLVPDRQGVERCPHCNTLWRVAGSQVTAEQAFAARTTASETLYREPVEFLPSSAAFDDSAARTTADTADYYNHWRHRPHFGARMNCSAEVTEPEPFQYESEELADAVDALSEEGFPAMLKGVRVTSKSLFKACAAGDLKRTLALLVEERVSPNWRNQLQACRTAVHGAAEAGHILILLALKQHGAQMDISDRNGHTPLFSAVRNKRLHAIDFFQSCAVDFNMQDRQGKTPLHHACEMRSIDVVNKLLTIRGLNVNLQDCGGWTALMWCAEARLATVAELLVSKGARVDVRDAEANTSLHWAAFGGSAATVSMLMRHGAEVNAQTIHGNTPLHIAARLGHDDCVSAMLMSADVTLKNGDGETAVHLAEHNSSSYKLLQFVGLAQRNVSSSVCSTLCSRDISRGLENIPIRAYNEVDDEKIPNEYTYVTESVQLRSFAIDRNILKMKSCKCSASLADVCRHSSGCACAHGNVANLCWYTKSGLLNLEIFKVDNPIVYECNMLCRCHVSCANRVVQHGIQKPLELFKTAAMGWGVRTRYELRKGTFVCEYVGELIPDKEANEREDDSYIFDLGHKGVADMWCIDARYYGNISRFINHSCEPNLKPLRVLYDHRDVRFPRMALFACRDIPAGGELSFDYGKSFWKVKKHEMSCHCASSKCRYKSKK